MKNFKIIIITAICFLSLNLFSQTEEKNNRFVQYGYFGIESGIIQGENSSYFAPTATIGFKKGFEFSFDYKAFEISNPDFKTHRGGIPIFLSVYEMHGFDISRATFNIGKSVYNSKKMRVTLSAGPSFIQYNGYELSGSRIIFYGRSVKRYTVEEEYTGLDIEAKLDLTAAKVAGVSIFFNSNFSEVQNYYSTGLALNFGKMK